MTENVDYTGQLNAIGKTVIGSLIERGISSTRATEAAQAYVNAVSAMVTAARNFKTYAYTPVPVEIGETQVPELRTIVTRKGDEWGKISLAKDEPLRFKVEHGTPGPPPGYVKYEIPI
jgi:hypothetical protein